MIDKEIVKEYPIDFAPSTLVDEAMQRIVSTNREEAIAQISKLIVKEYQTRFELSKAKKVVEKIEERLKKTAEKVAKVRAGDLSVLFADDNQKPVEEEHE